MANTRAAHLHIPVVPLQHLFAYVKIINTRQLLQQRSENKRVIDDNHGH